MIGEPINDDDLPPGTRTVWAPPHYDKPPEEVLAWLQDNGVDPGLVAKNSFRVVVLPDGSTEIVFHEYLPADDGHLVWHAGDDCCPERSHFAQTGLQHKRMGTPLPPTA